jgi:hypothetical protein
MSAIAQKIKSHLLTEILILPDGRILVQNITPTMAKLLSKLNPEDELMRERARVGNRRGLNLKAHKQS